MPWNKTTKAVIVAAANHAQQTAQMRIDLDTIEEWRVEVTQPEGTYYRVKFIFHDLIGFNLVFRVEWKVVRYVVTQVTDEDSGVTPAA